MIELLLQAERTLTVGLVDEAERLYWQAVENDPRNAIAVVGLARVAVERGDDRTAYTFACRALEIDPDNLAAVRLELRLAEILATRGEPVERPAHAIEAAARAQARAQAGLEEAARRAPAPAPPVADYPAEPATPAPATTAPPGSPGDSVAGGAIRPEPGPGSPAAPKPPARRPRAGLFRRLVGR